MLVVLWITCSSSQVCLLRQWTRVQTLDVYKTKTKMWEPVVHSLRACYDGHGHTLTQTNTISLMKHLMILSERVSK